MDTVTAVPVRVVRMGAPIVSVIAANTSYTLWLTSPHNKAVIRKIMAMNRTGAACYLNIGYLNLSATFVPVMPPIYLPNNIDVELEEHNIPQIGNTVDGFCADTTASTGTLGNIIIQCTAGAAAPNNVLVTAEIEEF